MLENCLKIEKISKCFMESHNWVHPVIENV